MKKAKNLVLLLLVVLVLLTTMSCQVANGKMFEGTVKGNITDAVVTKSKSANFTAAPVLEDVFKNYTATLTQSNTTLEVNTDAKTFVFPEVEVGEY